MIPLDFLAMCIAVAVMLENWKGYIEWQHNVLLGMVIITGYTVLRCIVWIVKELAEP